MSLHRRNPRRDENEREIVAALRALGADVRHLSGANVPDLLVGWQGRTILLGVKRPDGPRGGTAHGRDRQSGDQRPATWDGGPWVVVTSISEAIAAVTDDVLTRSIAKVMAEEIAKGPCRHCGGRIGPDLTGRPMCYGCGPLDMLPARERERRRGRTP